MATRTYRFTETETAQFARLVALGFERCDYFEGTEDPQVCFHYEIHGLSCTFFPEPYKDPTGKVKPWRVEVRQKTEGGFGFYTTDAWISMAECSCLIEPVRWSDMLSALKGLKCLADWEAVMRPLLTAVVASPE